MSMLVLMSNRTALSQQQLSTTLRPESYTTGFWMGGGRGCSAAACTVCCNQVTRTSLEICASALTGMPCCCGNSCCPAAPDWAAPNFEVKALSG
jgi:hypothetical protein